jgi:hypothetical protein
VPKPTPPAATNEGLSCTVPAGDSKANVTRAGGIRSRRPLVLREIQPTPNSAVSLEREEQSMNKVALVLPFVLIAIAPFVGRWRANAWLKTYRQKQGLDQPSPAVETLAESA